MHLSPSFVLDLVEQQKFEIMRYETIYHLEILLCLMFYQCIKSRVRQVVERPSTCERPRESIRNEMNMRTKGYATVQSRRYKWHKNSMIHRSQLQFKLFQFYFKFGFGRARVFDAFGCRDVNLCVSIAFKAISPGSFSNQTCKI